jgi:N-hydroxyarylamine O-acetyltransferase
VGRARRRCTLGDLTASHPRNAGFPAVVLNREVTDPSPWQTELLDLYAYLSRVGAPAGAPSRPALAALHEAHVRTFTFDNLDVLLDQHPGVQLDAVQEKFVGRGRGGYCFQHNVLFAAVLERLGYHVERRLGRVGDPSAPRTHCVVVVTVDGEQVLADPGFGMSLLRPIPLTDGAEDAHGGWRYRLRLVPLGAGRGWALERWREEHWEPMHTHDELPVQPLDYVMGHHFTSTYPTTHFRKMLMLTRHLPDRHVAVTHEAVTVRRPGRTTEHRELRDGELNDLLDELGVSLTADERARLNAKVRELRSSLVG